MCVVYACSLCFGPLFSGRKRLRYSPPVKGSNALSIIFSEGTGRAMAKKERDFQAKLIDELEKRYRGCIVLKNDPRHKQGIPDLTIFHGKHWATLECKRSENEDHQPNQDYYVEKMNGMSYSTFIFPENRERVLRELDDIFGRDAEGCE